MYLISMIDDATSRLEKRLDGEAAIRFRDRRLDVTLCLATPQATAPTKPKTATARFVKNSSPREKSRWMDGFLKKPGPPMGKAIHIANATG